MIFEGKILFLGDSITDGGSYHNIVDTYCKLNGIKTEIVNLGLMSETVSNLSEPTHPFPRPCVLDRVDNALKVVKPDIVSIMYGINDAIFYPLIKENFDAYCEGMKKLVDIIRSYGAKIILITPGVFDNKSVRNQSCLKDLGEKDYSFERPYKNYNEVMQAYAKWIMTDGAKLADVVVDIHSALTKDIENRRLTQQDYSSGDGIHFNLHGHFIIAREIIAKTISPTIKELEFKGIQNIIFKILTSRNKILHCYYKETIGHTNIYHDKYLPKVILDKKVAKLNKKIDFFIKFNKN